MTTFAELLGEGTVVAPPVYDGFTALIAQRGGAAAVSVPVDATASQAGVGPDEVSVDQLVDNVRYVATAVAIPVIAATSPPVVRFTRVTFTSRCRQRCEAASTSWSPTRPTYRQRRSGCCRRRPAYTSRR